MNKTFRSHFRTLYISLSSFSNFFHNKLRSLRTNCVLLVLIILFVSFFLTQTACVEEKLHCKSPDILAVTVNSVVN